MMNEESAIRDFLGERPGTGELREWRETLEHRLASLRQECPPGEPSPRFDSKIKDLERQIAALRQEEAVTQFVEDSVRATLAMGAVVDGMDEFEE